MTGLPTSLSIALWVVAAAWGVAILGLILDVPGEIVLGSFAFGIVGGVYEWVLRRGGSKPPADP